MGMRLFKKREVVSHNDETIYHVTVKDIAGITWADRTLEFTKREDARKYKQALKASTAGLTGIITRVEYVHGKVSDKREVW